MNIAEIIEQDEGTKIPPFKARIAHVYGTRNKKKPGSKTVVWQDIKFQDSSGTIKGSRYGTLPDDSLGKEVIISKSIRTNSKGDFKDVIKNLSNCIISNLTKEQKPALPSLLSQIQEQLPTLKSLARKDAIEFFRLFSPRGKIPINTYELLAVADIFFHYAIGDQTAYTILSNEPGILTSKIKVSSDIYSKITEVITNKKIPPEKVKILLKNFNKTDIIELDQDQAIKFYNRLSRIFEKGGPNS